MSSRYIIAAGDISSSPVLARKFRGKTAKEIYRCGKRILVTGSIAKPVGFALSTVPREMSKGFVSTAVGQVGETAIGYLSGIGFVRYIYKVAQPSTIKTTARLIYNVAYLPMTLYSKGIGEPVYIFDDNRLWIEKNFTLNKIFETVEERLTKND